MKQSELSNTTVYMVIILKKYSCVHARVTIALNKKKKNRNHLLLNDFLVSALNRSFHMMQMRVGEEEQTSNARMGFFLIAHEQKIKISRGIRESETTPKLLLLLTYKQFI